MKNVATTDYHWTCDFDQSWSSSSLNFQFVVDNATVSCNHIAFMHFRQGFPYWHGGYRIPLFTVRYWKTVPSINNKEDISSYIIAESMPIFQTIFPKERIKKSCLNVFQSLRS